MIKITKNHYSAGCLGCKKAYTDNNGMLNDTTIYKILISNGGAGSTSISVCEDCFNALGIKIVRNEIDEEKHSLEFELWKDGACVNGGEFESFEDAVKSALKEVSEKGVYTIKCLNNGEQREVTI